MSNESNISWEMPDDDVPFSSAWAGLSETSAQAPVQSSPASTEQPPEPPASSNLERKIDDLENKIGALFDLSKNILDRLDEHNVRITGLEKGWGPAKSADNLNEV